MNKDSIIFYEGQHITDLKPASNTLIINAKRVIVKNMELGIEIDLTGKVNQFNKIIVDGIIFIKENKNE